MSQYYFLALFLVSITFVHSVVVFAEDDQTREIITEPGKCADVGGGILDRLEITNCTKYEGCTIYSNTTIILRYQPSQQILNPQYKFTFTPDGGHARSPIVSAISGPWPGTRHENITIKDLEKFEMNNCKALMKLEILNDKNQADICVAGRINWSANPKSTPCNNNNFATGLSASVMTVLASILMALGHL